MRLLHRKVGHFPRILLRQQNLSHSHAKVKYCDLYIFIFIDYFSEVLCIFVPVILNVGLLFLTRASFANWNEVCSNLFKGRLLFGVPHLTKLLVTLIGFAKLLVKLVVDIFIFSPRLIFN